jgi:hypothetical protein
LDIVCKYLARVPVAGGRAGIAPLVEHAELLVGLRVELRPRLLRKRGLAGAPVRARAVRGGVGAWGRGGVPA